MNKNEISNLIQWLKNNDFEATNELFENATEEQKQELKNLRNFNCDDQLLLFTNTLDILPYPIFIKDDNLSLVFCNKSFERFVNSKTISSTSGDISSNSILNNETFIELEQKLLKQSPNSEIKDVQIDNTTHVYSIIHLQFSNTNCDSKSYIVGTIKDITEITDLNKTIATLQSQINQISQTDELTGVGNRRFAERHLDSFINNHLRYEEKFAVIMLDIDNMQKINENFGYIEGNLVLLNTAKKLKQILRSGDMISRLGGDEFLILVKDRVPSTAKQIASRIQKEINEINIGPHLHITCSLGVAVHAVGETKDSILARVSNNLMMAQKSGKNTIVLSASNE